MVTIFDTSNKNGTVTLSEDKLTATCVSGGSGIGITTKKVLSSGIYYCEITTTKVMQSALGVVDSALNMISKFNFGSGGGYVGTYSGADALAGVVSSSGTVGILVNTNTREITFSGAKVATKTISCASGYITLVVQAGDSGGKGGDIFKANFGGSAFVYSIPDGAVAWDGGSGTVPKPQASTGGL